MAAITQLPVRALRAGVVKVRSAAERGVGAERRDLDGDEHSATITRVMAAHNATRNAFRSASRIAIELWCNRRSKCARRKAVRWGVSDPSGPRELQFAASLPGVAHAPLSRLSLFLVGWPMSRAAQNAAPQAAREVEHAAMDRVATVFTWPSPKSAFEWRLSEFE